MRMPLTLSQYLNRITPRCARLLARDRHHRGVPLTRDQIAQRSGLSIRRIDLLATKDSWDGIPVDIMCAYLEACGITLQNRGKELAYFVRSTIKSRRYLSHTDRWKPAFLRRLLPGAKKALVPRAAAA